MDPSTEEDEIIERVSFYRVVFISAKLHIDIIFPDACIPIKNIG